PLSLTRRPPTSTLFPYTTLFRSDQGTRDEPWRQYHLGFAPTRYVNPSSSTLTVRIGCRAMNVQFISSFAVISSDIDASRKFFVRSEEHTSELQSRGHLVCRLLLE